MKQNIVETMWIIKNSKGKVIGPYTKEAIFNLIDRKIINGEELIAIYPDGNWEPFVREVEFYDRLMDVLEGGVELKSAASHEQMEENTVVVLSQPKSLPQQISKIRTVSETGVIKLPTKIDHKKIQTKNNIEKKSVKNSKKSKIEKLLVVVIAISLLFAYFIFFDKPETSHHSKIHLLAPGKVESEISAEEYSKNIKLVRSLLENDNFSDWYESQNILVKLAEGLPDNTEIREMICFVHKELWPFSFQDAEDLRVLNYMTQTTRTIRPEALHGRSCQMIQSLLTGNSEQAKNQLDQLLLDAPDSIFYGWIKADLLLKEKDFINAQGFTTSVINMWPEFLRAQIILAQSFEGAGQFQQAVESYQSIVKKNPKHKVAKIHLGVLEFDNFRAVDTAWIILTSALNASDLVPTSLEAKAYRALTEMSLLKNQTSLARKYIEKAYNLDPVDSQIRELYKSLNLNKKHEIKDGKTAELVALGDQYARTGDCFAAQAQYKTAFDLDPNSGLAAFKAAKCLWKISQSLEAIEYLKKSINNSPEYLPAYILLGDYYSQRFDFALASRILDQAKSQNEESYELFRGQAQLEYRKNNFKSSIALAQRAAKIYDTDIETYMLLALANLGMGEVREAFHAATRAIELDSVNIEAQVVYAKVLHNYQGMDPAIAYLEKQIKQHQNILEYKLAIADIYKKEERFPNAMLFYQEVVAINPKNKTGLIGLGECFQGMGQMENGLSSFLAASIVDPTDPEALFKAGILYFETARFGPAIQQFERVLLVNSKYPRVRFLIGKAAFAQGDIQKALEFANLEKKQNPNLADSYVLIAEIYLATHKYSLCTAEYQQAIRLQPQGASIYVKIAKCYRLSGSFDVASSMLEIAIQKESGYPEIYKEKGATFQALGEYETAIIAYEKYLALSPNATDKSEVEMLLSTMQSK